MNCRLFRAAIWTLLLFLIILVGTSISFVFRPLLVVFNTLFFPFLIAGFLYFLTYPLVDWLQTKRLPRSLSILMMYLAFASLLALVAMVTVPVLQREAGRLVKDAPAIANQLGQMLLSLQENPLVKRLIEEEPQLIEGAAEWLTGLLDRALEVMTANLVSFLELAADFLILLVITPFILFYMLKDGYRWPDVLLKHVPDTHRTSIRKSLAEISRGISSYIQGIFLVCVSIGVLVYIGYIIIGMDYPLILAAFAMVTNVIPFLGPIIGSIPAVLVGIFHSPLMAAKVILVVVVVQQIESLLISPQVMGRKLAIGPLTVILLVLVSGRMAGLLGMILALPSFVILKIVVNHLYRLYITSRT